jgi:hypothetical protein
VTYLGESMRGSPLIVVNGIGWHLFYVSVMVCVLKGHPHDPYNDSVGRWVTQLLHTEFTKCHDIYQPRWLE